MPKNDIKMQKSVVDIKSNRVYGRLNASYEERKKWYLSARWRTFRDEFLKLNRYCVRCQDDGKINAAVIVDHVDGHDPLTWQETFWDGGKGGFQALCWSCHSRKTALEDQKRKPKRMSASERRRLSRQM